MIKKRKFILLLLSLFGVGSIVSCNNQAEIKNSLSKIIDEKYDYIDKLESVEEQRTTKILNDLLDKVFADNLVERREFLDQQNDVNYQKEILKKLQELLDEAKNQSNSIIDQEVKTKFIDNFYENKIFPLYSENWYFILKNINLFYGEFYNWLTIPKDDNSGSYHSEKFLSSLRDLKTPKNVIFINSILDKLEEGEESAESYSNYIFYLSKNKIIFRIKISRNSTSKNKLTIEPWIWYFPFSKTNNISIKLISNILHSAYVHGDQIGFDRFESDLVEKLRYGVPSKIILKIKDNYEN
ncbi:hypothetical protein MADP07_00419 [Mycoplasma anatis]|uniref:Lipoprotein n=1 Tax=Mycoplasmopsis anatis TaxID=171279 RepID=A0A9Q3L8U3_9BACT|nr:aromatic motif membrane protein [Mycoplasmopsis anatis]MBW0596096.1 hypothetical protein [Mycoplasmopsis anatis]MBW0597057.1 hypothetical protein [Mycoplasmopsis anatis]MBW0597534.1 hypothetical protein [Mycoplasmopsis anatis]MBW0600059.1 hypothetical protein [Mycoplasmopsis anatis]MBW0600454.1 hypothetical protein [Mycoplasmopsis anatis]